MSTERSGIEGARDIGDGGSANIDPGEGRSIDPYNGDITREGWGGLTTYTPWI